MKPFIFLTSLSCITNLSLIICLLIFQFSLLCRPPSLHPFLPPRLKRFTSRLSRRLGTLTPFNTTLISSFLLLHLLLFFCLILYLFRSANCPLCNLPIRPLADSKPCQSRTGPATFPTVCPKEGRP